MPYLDGRFRSPQTHAKANASEPAGAVLLNGAPTSCPTKSLFWLSYRRNNGLLGVVIVHAGSLLEARMLAAIDGVDDRTHFLEGHELRTQDAPSHAIGRMLPPDEAHKLRAWTEAEAFRKTFRSKTACAPSDDAGPGPHLHSANHPRLAAEQLNTIDTDPRMTTARPSPKSIAAELTVPECMLLLCLAFTTTQRRICSYPTRTTCAYRKPHPAARRSRIGQCCRRMWNLCRLIWWALVGRLRPRAALEAEILVLRQQINVLRRTVPRPRFGSIDRLIFVGLCGFFPNVRDALAIVQPDTVIRWHRAGFRAYWRWKSRARGGRPKVSPEMRRLIHDMSLANPLWGAPRIHGELLKLGIEIGQTSVAKYMARRRRPPSQGWRTFLRNHADGIAAMDLFVVPTISFRLLYGLLILRHDRRRILWLGVTAHPTAEWIARQLVEACGWKQVPEYILRDRDRVYGQAFARRIRAMGIRDRPTSARSPWQNAYAERLIGSIRRECVDHIIVLGERHLRHILLSYLSYYNAVRTHLSLGKDAPVPRAVQAVGRIVPTPILGGLHHQYLRT